jgi:uncharacterized protein (TIGR03435 family)
MEDFADYLTSSLSRPVFDHTNLKGVYQIDLSYLGDEPLQQDSNTPIATLFQALEKTLGLKLEFKKAPLEMIVFDSGNKIPTEN